MSNTTDLNAITEKIIRCAIEVHKNLGPGLLESLSEKAMCHELSLNNISFLNKAVIPIRY